MTGIPPSRSPNILRAKSSLKRGDEFFKFLTDPDRRAIMRKAADDGVVVVSRLSEPLLAVFALPDLKPFPVRQFIGALTKAVLAEEGYDVAVRGVRVPGDRIFTKGSKYRQRQDSEEGNAAEWLTRLVAIMTRSERARMVQLLAAQ
jgi:hypothetical protein